MAKDSETVLEGFQEGPLKFPPTYKFDVGTDTYDTRLVMLSASGNWWTTEPSSRNSAPFLWRFLPAREKHEKVFLSTFASPSHVFSVPRAVGKSVNRLGLTGSCGAWGPLHLPTQLWTQGSVAPLQGWRVGPKSHSTATGVTWSTQPVTTNLYPPSSPCRWDTSQVVFLWYEFCEWYKNCKLGKFFIFFMLLVCDEDICMILQVSNICSV